MSTTNQDAEKWSHADIRLLDTIVDYTTKEPKVKAAKDSLQWVKLDKKLLARALTEEGLIVQDEQTGELRRIRFFVSYRWAAYKVVPTETESES